MSTPNPFQPPRAAVGDVAAQSGSFQTPEIWSAKGRLGRLRYLAYSAGAALAFYALLGALVVVAGAQIGVVVAILLGIPLAIFNIMVLIRRAHDIGWSGWSCLTMVIPLVSLVFALIFIFKSGTQGDNEYGPPTIPNTTGVKVLGLGLPIFALIIGILAAVSLPAYQDYVTRARAAGGQTTAPTE